MKSVFGKCSLVLVAAAVLSSPQLSFAQAEGDAADRCSRGQLSTITGDLIRSVDQWLSGTGRRSRETTVARQRVMRQLPAADSPYQSAGLRLVAMTNSYFEEARRDDSSNHARAHAAARPVQEAYNALPQSLQRQYECYLRAQSGKYDGFNPVVAGLSSSPVAQAGAPARDYSRDLAEFRRRQEASTRMSRRTPSARRVSDYDTSRERRAFESLGIGNVVVESSGPTSAAPAQADVVESDSGVQYGGHH